MADRPETGVELFWLPLGAGGRSVRLDGDAVRPPAGGRAPACDAGLVVARRS